VTLLLDVVGREGQKELCLVTIQEITLLLNNSFSRIDRMIIRYLLVWFLLLKGLIAVHASNVVLPKIGTFVIPTQKYGTASYAIITPPTSTSVGPWSYISGNSQVATVYGSVLTITGAGSTTITASQAASGSFASIKTSTTFIVTPGTPLLGPFTIPIQFLGNKSWTLVPPPSTSSGSWSYKSSKPKVATVSGSKVTLLGIGTTTITATQAATANWRSVITNALMIVMSNKPTNSFLVPTTDSFGQGTNTFSIDFVPIGNPGNSNDPTTGYGGVAYEYRIGKYTISQNQIDGAVKNGLQNVGATPWKGDQPATGISWYEAANYVNWLNASKGYASAYNLTFTNGAWSVHLWATNPDINGNVAWANGGINPYRNANCLYFLPSDDEWYKAAYYDPTKYGGVGGYWLYPTGSDSGPLPISRGTNSGTAVFTNTNPLIVLNNPASIYQSGGLSPSGTMGQGGNVVQWIETSFSDSTGLFFIIRGGEYEGFLKELASNWEGARRPDYADHGVGFRIARKP
jgi:formylglycine-generating enzyme